MNISLRNNFKKTIYIKIKKKQLIFFFTVFCISHETGVKTFLIFFFKKNFLIWFINNCLKGTVNKKKFSLLRDMGEMFDKPSYPHYFRGFNVQSIKLQKIYNWMEMQLHTSKSMGSSIQKKKKNCIGSRCPPPPPPYAIQVVIFHMIIISTCNNFIPVNYQSIHASILHDIRI